VNIFNPGTDNSILNISQKAHATGMDPLTSIFISRNIINNDLIRLSTISHVLGSKVIQFRIDPENCAPGPFVICSSASPNSVVQITLSMMDQNIPVSDVASKTVTLTTKISPKNYSPVPGQYFGRFFNGDYEDVIQ